MVGSLYLKEFSKEEYKRKRFSFKPYFRWLAPYTMKKKEAIVFDGTIGFKPYFRWLAPYTLVF